MQRARLLTERVQQYPSLRLLKRRYVNDYLYRFAGESEPKKVSAEVRLLHRNSGFHLQN